MYNVSSNIVKIINYINFISAILLIFSLPAYYGKIQYYSTILFFSSYLLEILIENRYKDFTFNKTKIIFLLFIAYFLLAIVYIPFEKDSSLLNKILEIRLPFLALGIVGLFGFNKIYRLRCIAYSFIITSLTYIFYLFLFRLDIDLFLTDPFPQNILAFARMKYINSHMIFNYFLNTSLIFAFYLLFNNSFKKYILLNRVVLILSALIIYSVLLLSEGRVGFIMANVIIFGTIFYKFWFWKRYFAIIFGLLFLFFGILLVTHHNRFKNNAVAKEPRLIIWKLAFEVIEENPLWGNGASTGANLFMDKLAGSKEIALLPDDLLHDVINCRRPLGAHAHNQFLMTAIEFGIVGLLLFLVMNLYPLFVVKKERFIFVFMLVIISFTQLFTDILFSGITPLTYTLVIVLFFNLKDDSFKKIDKVL